MEQPRYHGGQKSVGNEIDFLANVKLKPPTTLECLRDDQGLSGV